MKPESAGRPGKGCRPAPCRSHTGRRGLPLYALLPDCDAVVHHGGAGSAMVSGTPQLAITFASEQACLATRIATSGAGLHLPGHTATTATIRAAVAALLHGDQHHRAAADLRRAAADRPPPVELLPRLEKLAAWAARSGRHIADTMSLTPST
ncbi:nucleotide disphospho-sugar-binding domain-containing protein [Dactylosporangium sp. NPDC049742]|uniref:glycosyltransferase n=1 Tax=Dactylosporangium sp. NPDC049742 TaxID=3154737 RepID=UPI00343DEA30